MIIGLVGMILLLLAWLFEVEQSIRKHKIFIDLRFAMVYLTANIMLMVYSYQIGDPVFFWLQVCLFCIVSFEVAYSSSLKKKK